MKHITMNASVNIYQCSCYKTTRTSYAMETHQVIKNNNLKGVNTSYLIEQ